MTRRGPWRRRGRRWHAFRRGRNLRWNKYRCPVSCKRLLTRGWRREALNSDLCGGTRNLKEKNHQMDVSSKSRRRVSTKQLFYAFEMTIRTLAQCQTKYNKVNCCKLNHPNAGRILTFCFKRERMRLLKIRNHDENEHTRLRLLWRRPRASLDKSRQLLNAVRLRCDDSRVDADVD